MTTTNLPKYKLCAYVPLDGDKTGPIGGKQNPSYKEVETSDINIVINRMADIMESDNNHIHWHFFVNGKELDVDHPDLNQLMQFACWRLGIPA